MVARRFDPFEPLFLFALAYGAMFVVRPAAMLANDSLVFIGPARTLDVSDRFTEMLVLALVGAAGFAAGYAAPLGRRLAALRSGAGRCVDDSRLIAAALGLAFLGLAAFGAFLAAADGLDTLGDMVRARQGAFSEAVKSYRYAWMAFYLLTPAALALFGLGLERRRKVLVAGSLGLTALLLFPVVLLGNRIVLLPLFGGMITLYYVQRRRRPSLAALAALAVVALFASAFLSDLRGRETRGEGIADTIVRATNPSRVVRPFTSGPDAEMAPALAAALSVIPEKLPYRYGTAVFGDLVVRPIPRPLWSGKPRPPRVELIAAIWPVEHSRGTIRPEFSTLLYFYWDFGVVGVLLGLAVYGGLARYLYESYRLRGSRLSVRVLYSLSLWFVVIAVRNSPVDTLVWAGVIVLPAWLIFRLARSPTHERASAPLLREASSSQ
jgi:hypothetical protein